MTDCRDEMTMRTAVERAVLGRCPCCGKGSLFARYLKQVDHCSVCGEPFGQIRADDAAPWLTILIVGHLFLPLMFIVGTDILKPMWLAMALWVSIFIALSLLILPRAKGLFIAVLWMTRAPGSSAI